MSTGEEDHVRVVLEALGRVDFWRLAIKPGRPVGFGMVAAAGPVPVMGLPGNPVAAMTTFLCIGRPVLAALGAPARGAAPISVRLGFAYKKKAGRREFVRAVLDGCRGRLVARQARAQRRRRPVFAVRCRGLRGTGRGRHHIGSREDGGFHPLQRIWIVTMKVLYFAWLRQRTGVGEEEVTPPDGVADVAGLVEHLKTLSDGHALAVPGHVRHQGGGGPGIRRP